MATRYTFTPEGASPIGSNNPELLRVNERFVLAFDAATDEACAWVAVAPQGLTGTLSLYVHYFMASATSGNLYFQAQIEAITPGDATDLDATTSFDTANSGNGTVPGTAGYAQAITITLTNNDSIAAGDVFRVRLNRDADNASDTATGDAYVYAVEFRDGA